MPLGRTGRIALRLATLVVLAFMYIPLSLVIAYAFNESGTSAWPPSGFRRCSITGPSPASCANAGTARG